MPAGRPTKYDPAYCEQAEKLCKLGATDVEMADFFGVCEDTIHEWKRVHPEFSESIKSGKIVADMNVADKLYHRACGYSHDAVKIFMPAGAGEPVYAPYTEHYAPDTAAAFIWLKNRRGWRDKVDVGGDPDNPVNHKVEVTFRHAGPGDNHPAAVGTADTDT